MRSDLLIIMSRIIFIILSLYCFQATNAQGVDKLVSHGKKIMADLQTIYFELSMFKVNYPNDLNFKLSIISNDTTKEIMRIIRNGEENIKQLLDEAREKGEDFIYCHNAANAKMKEISNKAFIAVEMCIQQSFEDVNPLLASIDSTLEITNEAIRNLESLFINCPQNDRSKLESCVQRQINDINVVVANVIKSSLGIMDISKFITIQAERNTKSCTEEPLEKVRQGTWRVTQMSQECIELREAENLKIS